MGRICPHVLRSGRTKGNERLGLFLPRGISGCSDFAEDGLRGTGQGFRGHAIGKNFLLAAKLSLNFASYWVIFLSSL